MKPVHNAEPVGARTMRRIGYLRVSTAEQRPDRQIDGLSMICDELHVESLSAVAKRRPVYERVTRALRPGDVFVIWDLDRAYRSAKDALVELDRLHALGIDFHIAAMSIDTTSPVGRFIYTILSGLAEFERHTLIKRTREGMAAARQRGKRIGRPPKLTPDQLREASRRIAGRDATITAIAGELGVAPWTLTLALRRAAQADDQAA